MHVQLHTQSHIPFYESYAKRPRITLIRFERGTYLHCLLMCRNKYPPKGLIVSIFFLYNHVLNSIPNRILYQIKKVNQGLMRTQALKLFGKTITMQLSSHCIPTPSNNKTMIIPQQFYIILLCTCRHLGIG